MQRREKVQTTDLSVLLFFNAILQLAADVASDDDTPVELEGDHTEISRVDHTCNDADHDVENMTEGDKHGDTGDRDAEYVFDSQDDGDATINSGSKAGKGGKGGGDDSRKHGGKTGVKKEEVMRCQVTRMTR